MIAPQPRLAAIDVWGASVDTAAAIRAALGLAPGQRWQSDLLEEAWAEAAAAVDLLDLVLSPVGYEERVFLTIDVVEPDGTLHTWRQPTGEPTVSAALAEALARYNETREAFWKLDRSADERLDPAGHFASGDEALRRIEQQVALLLDAELGAAIAAVRDAGDEELRASLAYMLGWADQKQAVVAALLDALFDASAWVRNNAARALLPLALRAARQGDITLPLDPLLAVLAVPSALDRARAAALLAVLAEQPAARAALRAAAVPALRAMAGLRQPNNRLPARAILAMVALDTPPDLPDQGRQESLLTFLQLLLAATSQEAAMLLADSDPAAPAHQQLADTLFPPVPPALQLRLHHARPLRDGYWDVLVAIEATTPDGPRLSAAAYTLRWQGEQPTLWAERDVDL